MKIVVSTNFSEARAKTFFRFHLTKKSNSKYFYFGIGLLLVILGIIITFVFHQDTVGMIVFIAGVATFIIRPIQINSMVKKIVAKSKISGGKYIITIDDDFISYDFEGNVRRYTWKDITYVMETDDCFYVYTTPNTAIIFPKYAIDGEKRVGLTEFFKTNVVYKKYRFRQKAEE
jgi:hypothetical protein